MDDIDEWLSLETSLQMKKNTKMKNLAQAIPQFWKWLWEMAWKCHCRWQKNLASHPSMQATWPACFSEAAQPGRITCKDLFYFFFFRKPALGVFTLLQLFLLILLRKPARQRQRCQDRWDKWSPDPRATRRHCESSSSEPGDNFRVPLMIDRRINILIRWTPSLQRQALVAPPVSPPMV